jgi:PAS domain S-box-containing protein
MQKVVLPFLVSFIMLIIVISLNRLTHNRQKEFSERTEHSRTVIKLYDNLDIQLRSAEMYSPTYDTSSARKLYVFYLSDINKIETNLAQLRDSINDNKSQVVIVDSISIALKKLLPTLKKKNIPQMVGTADEMLFPELQKIHELIRIGLDEEETLLTERRKELRAFSGWNDTLTWVIAAFAVAIIIVTFFNQVILSKRRIWLEGFLASILNTSQNGIIYYKAVRKKGKIDDFKVVFANDAIQQLLNIDPNKIIGKKLSELDSYVRKTELFLVYIKAVDTGEPVSLEHYYKHNGIEKWLRLSISKLKDGMTVAIHDITDIKRYEEELKTNISALEQSNQQLEEYAYAASHDLQEPLRKIKTFGSFLYDTQQGGTDDTGKQHLEKILQSAERMSLLIKDLLSYSSLKIKEEFGLTDLTSIFENVLQDMEVLIEQKKAIITHDPLPEIEAIPIQINQLFYNLVNNSLKFSSDDLPLHLDVSCKLLNAEELVHIGGLDNTLTYYEIIFSDNGIGFNQDYANQIFGLFKRLNDKTVYAGSGIGLALCKKVVSNHKGIIAANAKEGIGAQFYIYLPQEQKPKIVSSSQTQ